MLQNEFSVGKSVTISSAKRLENCLIVVNVAIVVVVSQQSHIIFVFVYTSSSKFTDNVPIHNIYIIQEMLRVSRSSTKKIAFTRTPWNWSAANPSILVMNILNKFEVCFPVVDFPANGEQEHEKDTSCLVFSSNVRQLIVWCLSRGSGETASFHPIGTSLRRTANTVKFFNL